MTFRIEGLPELEQALADIANRSTRVAVTNRALRNAAEPMRAKAKQYASHRTGKLEESIKISTRIKDEAGAAAYAKTMRRLASSAKALGTAFDQVAAKAQALTAMRDARRAFRAINPPAIMYLGPTEDVFYGKWVEFGTGPRHQKNGRFVGSMPPDPFLRPAFDAEAKSTIERVAAALRVEIDKNAKRTAARKARQAAKG